MSIDCLGELTLIDTDSSSSGNKILQAVAEVSRRPKDIHHILVPRLHGDHTGSSAELKELTGSQTCMHPLDTDLVPRGKNMPPVKLAPGLANNLLSRLASRDFKIACFGHGSAIVGQAAERFRGKWLVM